MAISSATKIVLGVSAGIIVLAAGGVAAFALLSDDGAGSRENRASSELQKRESRSSEQGKSAQRSADKLANEAAVEEESRRKSEAAQTQAPAGPPEVTGECPADTQAPYAGVTREFSVRICQSGGSYTYVGGNGSLGFIVLPATLSYGQSGSVFLANNGATGYAVDANGLTVSPAGAEAWTQVWQSGNMASLR